MTESKSTSQEPITGQEIDPRGVIPQGTVKPGSGPLDAQGPRSWNDMIPHTGEARGTGDTARHSLAPDAPTVGASRRDDAADDDGVVATQVPSSSTGPD